MTNWKSLLVDYVGVNIPEIASSAGGSLLRTTDIGTVIHQAGDAVLKIRDVGYIPKCDYNLVSYGLLEEQGLNICLSVGFRLSHSILTAPEGDIFMAYIVPNSRV